MAKSFNTLKARMSPDSQERSRQKAALLMENMMLSEIRQALKLTQEQMAENLHVKQAAVSKLEHRTDMYISTLRNFLKAMGGDLEITAKFPEGSVKISQFEDLEAPVKEAHG